MATWDIRSRNGYFLLPDHAFPLASNSVERQGGHILSPFQRGNPTQGRKTHAFWQHGLREALHLQNKRSSENCSTRDFLADSVLPALGYLAVVMVQPSQDRNSNHFASFVRSGSR
jgi:hypothetical protein